MRFVSLMLCVCSVSVTRAGDPPPPNLEKPVDYVAWINSEFGVGERKNAAGHYLAACEQFVEDKEALEAAKKPARFWSPAEKKAVESWVKENEPALARLAEGAGVRRCFFKFESESGAMFDVMLPHLAPMRNPARALAARARLRLMSGDTDGALDDLETLLRSAKHVQQQPMIISYLVGVAVSALAHDVLLELPVIAGKEADYASIVKRLRRIDRKPPTMSAAITGERACIYDGFQRWCEDLDGDGKINVWRMPIESYGADADDIPVVPARKLQELTRKADEHLNNLLNSGKAPYSEVLARAPQLERDKYEWSAVYILVASLSRAEKIRRARDAHQHAARMVLYIHAYRAEHGEWPSTLAEATGRKLSAMRRDPFSDGELIYKLKGGKPRLYSVGADGKDNRGRRVKDDRIGEKADIVYWPLPEE